MDVGAHHVLLCLCVPEKKINDRQCMLDKEPIIICAHLFFLTACMVVHPRGLRKFYWADLLHWFDESFLVMR